MSTNISGKKREELISKINQIKTFIEQNAHDRNAANLLSYLGELTHEVNGKKYGLVFEEHREAIDEKLENNAPVFTEEKELFIDGGGELNFLLEGDNLASLKLLEKTHRGKIDVIYIDPPYNTGKEDFIYDDNYIGEDDCFRHSKWTSFISKRLEIARKLLSERGIIFISIDDNEYAPLKILCDSIFGENNRLSTHHIQVRYSNKNLNEKKDFQECLEYVLIYAKNSSEFHANRPNSEYRLDSFKYVITEKVKAKKQLIAGKEVEIFKQGEWEIKEVESNINALKETWITGSIYSGTGHGKTYQKIVEPRLEEDGLQCLYKIFGLGEDGLGYRYFTGPQKLSAKKGKMFTGVPLIKREEIESGIANKFSPIQNFYDFSPDFGNIRNEGGIGFNSGKKPVKMLKQFINYHKGKDITILDFFAGSGTTGHAVLKLNAEDGGHRKFILCTNNENSICREITYERLKTVITGKRRDGSVYSDGLPGSLKYFKTDFIDISEKMYYEYADELLLHVKELVELENAVNFDKDSSVAIVLSDEELEEFVEKVISTGSTTAITLYMGHDVLATGTQERILKSHGIKVNVIPDYYYRELAL